MNIAVDKVNIAAKFETFDAHWSPKVVGQIDDYEIKLVKLAGDFVWHKHDDCDEMFLVVDGHMEIDFKDSSVALDAGEFVVVPRGVEHMPRADSECRVMLFERAGVTNTGDAEQSPLTVRQPERI